MTTIRFLTALPLLAIALPAGAQTVSLTRITDLSTPVYGYGNRPALDSGMVAFLGEDTASDVTGIYMTPADGSGPMTLIVDQNTPIPNVPGETFRFLDNPEIHAGVVGFTGGFELLFIDKQGVYLGSGGPLTVHYDAAAASYNPQPFGVVMDGGDLTFRYISPDVSDPLGTPYYMPAAGTVIPIISSVYPGGGTVASPNDGDMPALGGGQAALSARVTHAGGIDGAVYTWSLAGQVFDLVANWNTQIPGTALSFEHFGAVDTDGANVVFVGQHGLLGFGGHQGVYLAPVGAGGAGPFTTMAAIGQVAPGSSETFEAFGDIAIDGDLVLFEAWLGHSHVPSGQGIYGWYDGTLFKVIDDTDLVGGQEILGADMNLRGLDGDQLALRVTFVNPVFPAWATDFGIYVADISLPVCQEDLGLAGPGTLSMSLCGDPLAAGQSATLSLEGGPASSSGVLALSAAFQPAFVPLLGGTVVGWPPVATPVVSFDAAGTFTATVAGGGGPLVLYAQAAAVDPLSPSGFALSNALKVELLP